MTIEPRYIQRARKAIRRMRVLRDFPPSWCSIYSFHSDLRFRAKYAALFPPHAQTMTTREFADVLRRFDMTLGHDLPAEAAARLMYLNGYTFVRRK